MLGKLSVLNAEEVSGGKTQFVSGRTSPLEWSVLRAGPLDARDDLISLGYNLLNLAVVVTESRQN